MLRRSLLVWGLGHLMLGDRRGWLLLVLQPVAIVAVALLVVTLIDGTRWLIIFLPLVALLVIWVGQAVAAHQAAIRRGAEPGGELAIGLLLPLAVTVLTLFWLVGGRHGSPSATLQAYIEAWMADRPDVAAELFATPQPISALRAEWSAESSSIEERIRDAQATYGAESGLDPERPFNSLRFRELGGGESGDDRVAMVVEIVRNRRVESTVLGFIPTASQETVAVEEMTTIWLERQPEQQPAWLPGFGLQSYSWKISSIDSGSGS